MTNDQAYADNSGRVPLIHTPVCDLLGIRHPIVLGGMAGGTSVPLVGAVSNAGGLGTLGMANTPAEQIPKDIAAIRATTRGPFGVNFLLFRAREPAIDAALSARPSVFSAAWARADQDLERSQHKGASGAPEVGVAPSGGAQRDITLGLGRWPPQEPDATARSEPARRTPT